MSETKQYHCDGCRIEAELQAAEMDAAREQGIHDALLTEGLEPTAQRVEIMRRYLAGKPAVLDAGWLRVVTQRGKQDVIKSEDGGA